MDKNQERYWQNRLGTQAPAVLGRVSELTQQREYPVIVSRAENSYKPELMYVKSLDEIFSESSIHFKFKHFYKRSGFKEHGIRSVLLFPEEHAPFDISYEVSKPILEHLLSQTAEGSYQLLKASLHFGRVI